MSENRKRRIIIIVLLIILLLLLAGWIFTATRGGTQTPAGHTKPQGAEISITVRDQNDDAIAGVGINVIDTAGNHPFRRHRHRKFGCCGRHLPGHHSRHPTGLRGSQR